MDSLQVTDQQSKDVAKSQSTRVSLADIEANILHEVSMNGGDVARAFDPAKHTKGSNAAEAAGLLAAMTIHIIVMRNGFSVIGKTAPADPENFNAELGRKFAREDAIRQIWPLMGYALRQELYDSASADRIPD